MHRRLILSLLALFCVIGCGGGGDLTTSVIGPSIQNLSVSPSTVKGGSSTSVTGAVSISSPAGAGGVTINLSSSDVAASTPSFVTISPGSTSAGFAIATQAVAVKTTVVITSTLGSSVKTANLVVTP